MTSARSLTTTSSTSSIYYLSSAKESLPAMSTPASSTCATSSPDISSFGLSISSPAFQSRSPIVNPLVSAGLICPDLMDILATPAADAAVAKRRVKGITGARDLTATEKSQGR